MAFKELLRVYKCYENKVDEKTKEYLQGFGTVDNAPEGLPLMEDVVRKYNSGEIAEGSTVICDGRVGDLWSDPTYNRIDDLRYGNQKRHIENRGGYSHDAADTLSAYCRPELKVVLTKGNNRASKRYACGRNPDSRVVISLKFHRKNISHAEMIRIESLDHTIDAQDRTSQSQEHKFTSSYFAKETDAVNLYNYLDQFSIGIAKTNSVAKFGTTSHNYIAKARKYDDTACTKYLTSFTQNNCENVVGGNAVYAGTVFLKTFKPAIDKIDELNNCDSFDGMMKYVFKDRNDKSMGFLNDITQASITAGNGKFKGAEVHVSRFISLYNEYCEKVLKATLPETNNHAIGYSSDAYLSYIKSADTDIRMRADEVARTTV
mgnify:CR=1 FL=1